MDNTYNYTALTNDLIQKSISLAESYTEWTKLAFSLSNLGEAGRRIFHEISRLSSKYDYKENERKFDEALKNNRNVSISTFIYMCKQAGINTNLYYNNDYSAANKVAVKPSNMAIKPEREISYIPAEFLPIDVRSNFVKFLCTLFDTDTLESPSIIRALQMYHIGAYNDNNDEAVIFPTIDTEKRIHSAKVMYYNPETGHREKDKINSLQNILKKKGLISAESVFVECLFGEHLTKIFPEKKIAIVESEKSAVIASIAFPQYNWLATGGKNKTDLSRCNCLREKDVILFPDSDGYSEWNNFANSLRIIGKSVIVSNIIMKKFSPADKADITDMIISDIQQKNNIESLCRINKNMEYLISEFNLKAV